MDVEYLTTRPESIQSRDEERRLTAAPHMNNEGLRSKDREVIATLQSGGRFFSLRSFDLSRGFVLRIVIVTVYIPTWKV